MSCFEKGAGKALRGRANLPSIKNLSVSQSHNCARSHTLTTVVSAQARRMALLLGRLNDARYQNTHFEINFVTFKTGP
jgi:hypothetical protein